MGRKQVISSFSGIKIDMDYILCVPSIHAIYDKEEAVIDFSGGIRERSSTWEEEVAGPEWASPEQETPRGPEPQTIGSNTRTPI